MTNLFHLCLKLGRGEEEFYILMWSLGRHFTMDSWLEPCGPSIDPDSLLPYHRGGYSIPPFQTHSCYFYAPLGEACCGRQFVDLYYQQHHPFPHCPECAHMVLGAASYICWQCRTYFWRYGTGMMQQVMGVTPQQHSILEVRVPKWGPHSAGYQRKNGLRNGEMTASLSYDLPFYRISFPTPVLAHFGAMCQPSSTLRATTDICLTYPLYPCHISVRKHSFSYHILQETGFVQDYLSVRRLLRWQY